MDYDNNDKYSIEEKAKELLGKSLKDRYPDLNFKTASKGNKGSLGQLVEIHHFKYQPNSDANVDFPEAGVELKCTPLKTLRTGRLSAKERLVLNIINYEKEALNSFSTSSFWEKNSLLLLMFYLHEKGTKKIDYKFKHVGLWRIPINDLKIIKDDWETINSKIRNSLAHELSESDTLYLSACTKGSTAARSLRSQYNSDIKAKQRAYSYKPSYMNSVIQSFKDSKLEPIEINDAYSSIINPEKYITEDIPEKYTVLPKNSIFKSEQQLLGKASFLKYVTQTIEAYTGLSDTEIAKKCNLDFNTRAKNKANLLVKGIFKVDKNDEIDEFVKGNIQVKTIKLDANENLKESMSFARIKYEEIINETWEESYFYEAISKKFLFIVFQKDSKNTLRLKKSLFWSMPEQDLEKAEIYWNDIKVKVKNYDFNNFYKSSYKKIFHVRPKARNKKDVFVFEDGRAAPKLAYWINRSYIKNTILL